jgi:serine/threonine protein kinase
VSRGIDYLGPFRLVRLVRVGQSCQIWEALRDGAEQRTCLKVIQRDLAKDKHELAFLKHEYEVAKDLNHKYIIRVDELNVDQGIPYIAMELFNARNLKQDIREQSNRVAHLATEIIERAAEALDHMHSRGWVHCDVKPDNFLVNDVGDLRLIDFAISERQKKGLSAIFGGKSGKIRGTRSYMSPEQILRKGVDARSDIYSFGCVLHELMSGKPPFTGATPNELLAKHIKGNVPTLAAANERVTPEFVNLVHRMMAKAPEKRPQSMKDFLKELRSIRVYRTGMKPPPPETAA